MAETARELVVLITHGMDDERSSVAFTIANGGLTAGLQVSIFLTSSAVDLVRKRAIEGLVVHPLEPLAALVKDFLSRGGRLWACTPCVKARGYQQTDLIDGVEITGASKMHELIKAGAATLMFRLISPALVTEPTARIVSRSTATSRELSGRAIHAAIFSGVLSLSHRIKIVGSFP